MNIGENIKKFRKKRGLTQKELSDKINKSTITVRKYEANDATPPIDVLRNIADALEIPLHLITRKEIDLTHLGLGCLNPNYDLIEKDLFPTDLVEYYKSLFERERQQRMEDLAAQILELKKNASELNNRIKEYEEYLNVFLEGTEYTLESFLNKIDNELKFEEKSIQEAKKTISHGEGDRENGE